jgi:hypothetical protein
MPWYSWNTAKVCVKHQPINQSWKALEQESKLKVTQNNFTGMHNFQIKSNVSLSYKLFLQQTNKIADTT